MRFWLRFFLWLFIVASPALLVDVQPVQAQSSRAVRARRARQARARRARARRARATRARRARVRRGRNPRAQQSRIAARPSRQPERTRLLDSPVPEDDGSVDMDFVDPIENERPPPMDTSYVAEVEASEQARRRSNLDPELFGGSGALQEDAEVPPGAENAPREPARYSPLTVRAGARGFHRGLDLLGYERGPISPYMLPIGAAVGGGLDYYPAAHVLNDGLAGLGVSFDISHSVFVESQGPNGIAYPTNALSWQLGLRYRGVLDDAGNEIAAEAAFGQQSFQVERGRLQDEAPEGVPHTDYTFARVGVAGRFAVGDLFLGVRGAYLPVIDVGRIGTELGGASAHGGELSLSLSIPLDLGFAIYTELDGRVFVLSSTPNDASPSSAAGALDRYIGLNVGVEWRMPSERDL